MHTTLDVKLQEVADQALGVYRGAIIVTEPSSGKILAMVSKPDYDPNQIEEIWDSLVEDKESGILLNRTTQGLYPPGSTKREPGYVSKLRLPMQRKFFGRR